MTKPTLKGFSKRIRFGQDQRRTFQLAGARNQVEAAKLGTELEAMARRLTESGHSAEALIILDRFARADLDSERGRVRRLVDGLCSSEFKIDAAKLERAAVTFRMLAKRWTSGELAADFPDHVAVKKTADHDLSRLEKICAIELQQGSTFGDLPLAAITLDHGEHVMRSLPDAAKRPATRRHYAQVMRRVLELAVYPCRIIERSPLPKSFMPKVGKAPSFSYLYPDEDAKLLGKAEIPLCYRILWGLLAREGCRVSEAIQLRVGIDIDLERGAVKLDKNKTDDARTWALDPGVTRALAAWIKLSKLEKGALLFTDEFGRPHEKDRLAERLRAHLKKADVERDELHTSGTNRHRLRCHDLRGTFVTLSLANGKTEAWVQDRTGHRSSVMVARYRRAARTAAELELGNLRPLDQAIPDLEPPEPELPPPTPPRTPLISKAEIQAIVQRSMEHVGWAAEPRESPEDGQQGGQLSQSPESLATFEDPEIINEVHVVAPSRLELERPFGQRILSPLRLPFRQGATVDFAQFVAQFLGNCKSLGSDFGAGSTAATGLENSGIALSSGSSEPKLSSAAVRAARR